MREFINCNFPCLSLPMPCLMIDPLWSFASPLGILLTSLLLCIPSCSFGILLLFLASEVHSIYLSLTLKMLQHVNIIKYHWIWIIWQEIENVASTTTNKSEVWFILNCFYIHVMSWFVYVSFSMSWIVSWITYRLFNLLCMKMLSLHLKHV